MVTKDFHGRVTKNYGESKCFELIPIKPYISFKAYKVQNSII